MVLKDKSVTLVKFLDNKKIQTRKLFLATSYAECFADKFKTLHNLPISENLGKNGLSIAFRNRIFKEKVKNILAV